MEEELDQSRRREEEALTNMEKMKQIGQQELAAKERQELERKQLEVRTVHYRCTTVRMLTFSGISEICRLCLVECSCVETSCRDMHNPPLLSGRGFQVSESLHNAVFECVFECAYYAALCCNRMRLKSCRCS